MKTSIKAMNITVILEPELELELVLQLLECLTFDFKRNSAINFLLAASTVYLYVLPRNVAERP